MSWASLLSSDPWVVAPYLLGRQFLSTIDNERVLLRITEVEAYGGVGVDPGSHSFRGQTPRNAVMFGAPGHAYIYFTYGTHWCLNVVAAPKGMSGGLLLRAGEVVEGMHIAQARSGRVMPINDVAKGPARLARALGITRENARELNSSSVTGEGPLTLLGTPAQQPLAHHCGPRTGVSGDGADVPWRFWLPNEPTVSPYKSAKARTEHLRP